MTSQLKDTAAKVEYLKTGVTIETITVTPELAKQMLATRAERQIALMKPWKAAMIRRDIAAGRWEERGETICFDWDGRLIDGQHRLAALLESDVTLTMMVVRGLPPEVWHRKDTWRDGRNPAAIRKSQGAPGLSGRFDALVRLVWLHVAGVTLDAPKRGNNRLMPTAMERANIEARFPDLGDICRSVEYFGGTPLRNAGAAVALFAITNGTKFPEKYDEFFEGIVQAQKGYRSVDQAWLLLRFLKNWVDDPKKKKPSDAFVAHCVVKAWNAFVKGETKHNFRAPSDKDARLLVA